MEPTSKTNTELFGHEEAEAQFLRDAAAGRLAHGWIIGGPQGIGKATLAYRLARALVGEENNAQHRIAAGSHGGLLVIEPLYDEKKEEFSREITVEQAREIGQFLSLTPGEGQWRVVIVDTADALNTNGAHAILKILEEPPARAVLLLVSHNPGRLLPTIRSRCRMLRLKPLADENFNRAVRHIMPGIASSHVDALGQLSDYAPGIARELEEQGAVESYEQLLALLAPLPVLDAQAVHGFAEQWAAGKAHAKWRLLLRLILCAFERAARQSAGERVPPIAAGEAEVLARLAALHPPAAWAAKWQQAADQFLLAEARHLDYKSVLITFLHSVPSKEIIAASG